MRLPLPRRYAPSPDPVGVDEETCEQVGTVGPVIRRPLPLERGYQTFRFFGRDQRLVSVVLDHPFASWLPLHTAFVAAAGESLGIHIPYRVTGVN